MTGLLRFLTVVVAVCVAPACSWQEPQAPEAPRERVVEARPVKNGASANLSSPGQQALQVALQQIGRPYRYGGADPDGFDCSGLVWFAFNRVGVQTPRTTRTLWRDVPRIGLEEARAGDLLFFRIGGKPAHVGLYIGASEFVHAPSSGKTVSRASLDSTYYRSRLIAVGRVAAKPDAP